MYLLIFILFALTHNINKCVQNCKGRLHLVNIELGPRDVLTVDTVQ